jgi:hypothetical protein
MMGPIKKEYIKRIRHESAYRTFRALATFGSVLFVVCGVLTIISGLVVGGMTARPYHYLLAFGYGIGGLLSGAACIVIGMALRQSAFILADVADSLTDFYSRHDQLPASPSVPPPPPLNR